MYESGESDPHLNGSSLAFAEEIYLAWLRDRREGAPYRAEIDRLLAAMTRRTAPPPSGGRWPGRRGRPG